MSNIITDTKWHIGCTTLRNKNAESDQFQNSILSGEQTMANSAALPTLFTDIDFIHAWKGEIKKIHTHKYKIRNRKK